MRERWSATCHTVLDRYDGDTERLHPLRDDGPLRTVRAARIVHRMRDVTPRQEGFREPGDVDELVHKVLMLTHKQAENHDVRLVWDPPDRLPPVPMVADRIQQVFLNLVLNAIDAMPSGGELRVRAARTEDPAGVWSPSPTPGPGSPGTA